MDPLSPPIRQSLLEELMERMEISVGGYKSSEGDTIFPAPDKVEDSADEDVAVQVMEDEGGISE